MSKSKNPYPEFLIDEVSGIKMPDARHQIWAEGYKARRGDRQVIKTAIKSENGMVMVFDKKGEQIPKYQGQCDEVKESILKDGPSEAVFSHGFGDDFELRVIPRGEW